MSLIDRLPEHLKNRKTAEAVTAPSAVLLAGGGAAARGPPPGGGPRRGWGGAVAAAGRGPLRDGLAEIGARLDAGVRECYRIARRGAALESGMAGLQTGVAWSDLMHGLDAFRVPAELRERVQQGESIRDHPALAEEPRPCGLGAEGLQKLEGPQ